jgi:hypothetical protein
MHRGNAWFSSLLILALVSFEARGSSMSGITWTWSTWIPNQGVSGGASTSQSGYQPLASAPAPQATSFAPPAASGGSSSYASSSANVSYNPPSWSPASVAPAGGGSSASPVSYVAPSSPSPSPAVSYTPPTIYPASSYASVASNSTYTPPVTSSMSGSSAPSVSYAPPTIYPSISAASPSASASAPSVSYTPPTIYPSMSSASPSASPAASVSYASPAAPVSAASQIVGQASVPLASSIPTVYPSASYQSLSASITGFINMGSGPYPEASALTSGTAQPWYDSPTVAKYFGGVPTAAQQASFVQTIVQDVYHTYQLAGIPITLTTNPDTPAQHTISVVSNTSYPSIPNAVGITDVGQNGFSFIDKFGAATNLTQFEWAVAHNVAHELMHAIGGGHHDLTGLYLDSAVTPWSTMINPNTTFSPAAVQDIESHLNTYVPGTNNFDAQIISGQNVPEPSTLATGIAGVLALAIRSRRSKRSERD